MSLIPFTSFPRSTFDMDQWMSPFGMLSPNLLEFDPFDELDRQLGRNLTWLNRPLDLNVWPIIPAVPQKYRITLDCSGYKPESVRTELINNNKQLVIVGKEDLKDDQHNFSTKEFKKTYNLPENVQPEKMVSFMTLGDMMVVEFPLKETSLLPNADLFPKITDNPDGTKQVSMRFNLPPGINPEHCNVTIKDRDLILRCEEKQEKKDSVSRFHYYQRTTLPENTNFNALKCVNENNQISITAPVEKVLVGHKSRKIPIENLKSTQALKESAGR